VSQGQEIREEPTPTEEGCQVDFGWLAGREVASVDAGLNKMLITFRDGQTLSIQASVWKGEAFLAFNPWRAPE
jgi:hypothetical protein